MVSRLRVPLEGPRPGPGPPGHRLAHSTMPRDEATIQPNSTRPNVRLRVDDAHSLPPEREGEHGDVIRSEATTSSDPRHDRRAGRRRLRRHQLVQREGLVQGHQEGRHLDRPDGPVGALRAQILAMIAVLAVAACGGTSSSNGKVSFKGTKKVGISTALTGQSALYGHRSSP